MDTPHYTPTRVADLVLQAGRDFIRHLKPLTLLTLPAVLFAMAAFGVFFLLLIQLGLTKAGSGSLDNWQTGVLVLEAGLLIFGAACFLAYMTYPIMRYLRDDLRGVADANLFHYWFPDKTLLGLIGMTLVFCGALVPLAPVIVIGFILLILPGAALCLLFGTLTQLAAHQYMLSPDTGIFEAMGRVWRWFTQDWLRMLGFGFLLSVVQCLVSLPGTLVREGIDIATEFHWVPGAQQFMLLGILAIPVLGVLFWAQMVLYYGLTTSILYRFLFDLEARDRDLALPADTPPPNLSGHEAG